MTSELALGPRESEVSVTSLHHARHTHTHTQCAWQKGLCVCLVSGATLGMLPFWGLCTVWSLAAGLQLNCQSHSGLVICVRQMLLSALCAPLCYLRTHTVLLMYFSDALLYKLFERTTLVLLLIVVRRADVHFWLAGLESSNCSFWIIFKGFVFPSNDFSRSFSWGLSLPAGCEHPLLQWFLQAFNQTLYILSSRQVSWSHPSLKPPVVFLKCSSELIWKWIFYKSSAVRSLSVSICATTTEWH